MDRPLLRASARAVYGQGIGLPVGAAIALTAATYPVLGSYGSQVLTGVTAILAFGLVCAVDDPAAGILAATPYSPTRRSLPVRARRAPAAPRPPPASSQRRPKRR